MHRCSSLCSVSWKVVVSHPLQAFSLWKGRLFSGMYIDMCANLVPHKKVGIKTGMWRRNVLYLDYLACIFQNFFLMIPLIYDEKDMQSQKERV
jgi:hypothetical protein